MVTWSAGAVALPLPRVRLARGRRFLGRLAPTIGHPHLAATAWLRCAAENVAMLHTEKELQQ